MCIRDRYKRILDDEESVVDLGAGANGFSYKFFPKRKSGEINYVAVEAVGQLVYLMENYFKQKNFPFKKAVLVTTKTISQWCNYYKAELLEPKKGIKKSERKKQGKLPTSEKERKIFVQELVNWIFENSEFEKILFETFSAVGTVGLSTGITPHLSNLGKILITISMFVGRILPLSLAIIGSRELLKAKILFPEEKVSLG